jgi:glycerol-3-phosphate dehydrogenase
MADIPPPLPTRRAELLARLADTPDFDLAVVGGGATGLGVALDGAARGLRVLLLEAHDFAQGTSSRSTKLVHGGVRYLAQGRLPLVREALRERSLLLAHAPHLARPLSFIVPSYRWWDKPFYGLGLKLYDLLAGQAGLGATELLSPAQTLQALPTVRTRQLRGGVRYWDGQFDDARLALALARTAARAGALLLNHCPVSELLYEQGCVAGLRCTDAETGQSFAIRARCVVNATGVWIDALRQQDGAANGQSVRPAITPSQGVHLVVDREFLPGDAALMVPKTADGRVLFAVPWLGKLILGTTDTPRDAIEVEPRPLAQEVDFILGEAGRYLCRAPTRQDVRSIWVGLRPLVQLQTKGAARQGGTQAMSREHAVLVSPSGLVSVTGGKWTTYRAMAEDVLAHCRTAGLLPDLPAEVTAHMKLIGAPESEPAGSLGVGPGIDLYGNEKKYVLALEGAETTLAEGLTEAMVRFAVRHEYARTVEDVLARRARLLFLDARQARKVAPRVADLLRQEGVENPQMEAFWVLTDKYLWLPD